MYDADAFEVVEVNPENHRDGFTHSVIVRLDYDLSDDEGTGEDEMNVRKEILVSVRNGQVELNREDEYEEEIVEAVRAAILQR